MLRLLRVLAMLLPTLSMTPWALAGDPSIAPHLAAIPAGAPKRVNLLLANPLMRSRGELMPSSDWSEIRRNIKAQFCPTRTLITEDSKPRAVLRQMTNVPSPVAGPPGRPLPADDNADAQESVDAVQRAYERPASERVAEIVVVTAAGGDLISATVSIPSGSHRFDEAAVEAVRAALTEHPPYEERRQVITRWHIRGSYAVTMPRVLAPRVEQRSNARMPRRGIPLPQPVWINFDESTGRLYVKRAFEDKIETEVTLVSTM